MLVYSKKLESGAKIALWKHFDELNGTVYYNVSVTHPTVPIQPEHTVRFEEEAITKIKSIK